MMEDFKLDGDIKAFVYLLKEGDDANLCQLRENTLVLIRKGKKEKIEIVPSMNLSVHHKKLLLPLISGGILTPFSFLSYFTDIFPPSFHILGIFIGAVLFYIGWAGSHALVIESKGYQQDFFLPSVSPNLKAFIEFANTYLKGRMSGEEGLFYIITSSEKGDFLFKNGDSPKKEENIFPLKLYTHKQFLTFGKGKVSVDDRIIGFDPFLAGSEISYEYDQEMQQLRPVLSDLISKDAVVLDTRS